MLLKLPPILAIEQRIDRNPIKQLIQPSYSVEVTVEPYQGQQEGCLLTPADNNGEPFLAVTNEFQFPEEYDKVLRVNSLKPLKEGNESSDISTGEWLRHPNLSKIPQDPINYPERIEEIIGSWQNAFSYSQEDRKRSISGLRPPQIGAVHAVHAHWTYSNEAATVVMPTGTGKTETMLSILISAQCEKVLVVVPTRALRAQISNKFLTLGILKEIGVVSDDALYPIVGILEHMLQSKEAVDLFFGKCNVVVTTMHIAGRVDREIQERMAHHCPFLFIDEAHHIGARTWKKFKQRFDSRRVLQFTATPYRNDDKPVGGKIVFNYPLGKAQEEGYFRPINFEPVLEFDPAKADQVVAEKAVEQLREDSKEYNHVLMARVGSIRRAKEVFPIYEQIASEFNPVQLHTGIKSKKRERFEQMILSGESKIIVCVDMLGEGFDLPELKIAAWHDVRKSLAVILQLVGRFTRAAPNLGDPTFVANIANVDVNDELDKLYSYDPDWNVLLRRSSEEMIQEQVDLWELVSGFNNFPEDIPLQNVRPAMSTVIYRTKCNKWTPDKFLDGIVGAESLERIYHDVNPQERILVIVTARKVPIDWAKIKDIFNWDWEMYVVFWDEGQNLLFINGSNNSGYYRKLAESVAGDDVELIKGNSVFRSLSGVNRMRLQNVGLTRQHGRLIRYTMRAGSNVELGLTQAQRRSAIKSNVFGIGYENGRKTSIGCSKKGRIWSRRVANIEQLTKWCSAIGAKVTDDTIDPDKVLAGTLVPVLVSERPRKMPIGIEWPETIYKEPEHLYEFLIDDEDPLPLYLLDLSLKEPRRDSELESEISSDDVSVVFKLNIFENNGSGDYRFSVVGNRNAMIRRRGAFQISLEKFFYEHPPVIWFADGSSLEGNSLTELNQEFDPYRVEKIQAWDWTGINLRNESQGVAKEKDSIQYRVVQELKDDGYDVIYDDDGSGEAADVVAIRIEKEALVVQFYHCKFSKKDEPGARIEDLYTVCGQAQKCIQWMEKPTDLFMHLLRRETRKQGEQEASRFEVGNRDDVLEMLEMSKVVPINLEIFIVQPGLSKAKASDDQLELLSVTENYLMETYQLPFGVIAST